MVSIAEKITQEESWLDYSKELTEIFDLHQALMSLEIGTNIFPNSQFDYFKQNVASFLVTPLFQYNLAAAKGKIESLLKQTTSNTPFYIFLGDLKKLLVFEESKKKEVSTTLATLAQRYSKVSIVQIQQDIQKINIEDPSDLIALVASYEASYKLGKLTGFPQGEEILYSLYHELITLLPGYSKEKLTTFLSVLADVIRYVIRTMNEPKDFFPELYDSSLANGRTEHVFQESLYKNLRNSQLASHYSYEPNKAAAGRIDVTYEDNQCMFPLEVKKTKILPTWSRIASDYLAQAQTYTNAYDQLGFFLVFDLTPKNETNNPINDIRELFQIQHLSPSLALGNNYPNYIISVIIPANKVSPSDMSTYR
ncbi:hypothetical protein QFZ48_002880 [Chitinophaga sp. W2I13]|uniref:hypothetical protein n=1 Tax=Chitinophaga sp. W2I13 TaxID=3373923 RepID=UPI003D241A30